MKPKRYINNRLHTFSRQPADPMARIKLARLDVDFVTALFRCGIDVGEEPSLLRIVHEAKQRALQAQTELL